MSDYDTSLEKIETENKKYLNVFEKDLKEQGFKDKTIRNHIGNAEFYINDFLNDYDLQSMQSGTQQVHEFLGDWFIRKACWSSCANIKSTAASIKKFYKSMLLHNYIEKSDYDELCLDIKEHMDGWLDTMRRYDEETAELFF